jgi:hypothetical protein
MALHEGELYGAACGISMAMALQGQNLDGAAGVKVEWRCLTGCLMVLNVGH